MKIKQYMPNYFDGFPLEEAEFESVEELRKIPFVKRWIEGPHFERFSLNCSKSSVALMAELREGKEWWVVGFISGGKPDLPRWTYPR